MLVGSTLVSLFAVSLIRPPPPLRQRQLTVAPCSPITVRAAAPSATSSVLELLDQLVPLADDAVEAEAEAPATAAASIDAPGKVSKHALESVRAMARAVLADSSVPPDERQRRLARLSADALQAGRP
eukprot:7089506-Prymnesium_polylepis.1